MASDIAIINRFSRSGDLYHLSAKFHGELDRAGKLAVVAKIREGMDPKEAVDSMVELTAAEIERLKVGSVFYRNGEKLERVDARRFHKRAEFYREQVEMFA